MTIMFDAVRCRFRIGHYSTDWVLMEHGNLGQDRHPHMLLGTMSFGTPAPGDNVSHDPECDFLKRAGTDLQTRPACHPS